MGYKNSIVYQGMAFDTPYAFKVRFLVREPVMGFQNIYFLTVRKELKAVVVRMALQTYVVIIKYCLLQVLAVADAYTVIMRAMTFPACKTFLLKFEMCALLIFRFNDFEIKLRKLFIPAMAVDAVKALFHPELSRMRKLHILSGMTVGTAEAFMVRCVKFIPVDHPF
jgi:hypothetical protein